MSVKISGQVWELDLDPIDKLVLLALADHADHEGNNIRPGNDLLCAKTGLSHQTISAKFKKFIEGGLLIPTNTFGRGRNREFMISLDIAERHQYFVEKEQRKMQTRRSFTAAESCKQGAPLETERCNLTEQKVQADSGKVQFDAIAYKEEPSEPSIEPSEREREQNPLVSFVEAKPANQPFSPNDDFTDIPPQPQWSTAERFVLKACELWDELANQEKPVVETNWKTKQSVQVAGRFITPRLSVENRIGGTPKLFQTFWRDTLNRTISPRPDYVVEQWEAYDRWLIDNHEPHRRLSNAA